MGKFTVDQDVAFRMDQFNFDTLPHGQASYGAHLIHIVYDGGGFTDLKGDFTYSNGQVFGTLSGIQDVAANGDVNYTLSGVSADAHQFSIDLQTSNEADALTILFAGDDKLSGSNLNDYLEGFAGKDQLLGGSGDDTLVGGAGNDTLIGGDGDDVLTGGSDKDVFYFAGRDQADTITDFKRGTDKIQIDVSGVHMFSDLRIAKDGDGGSLVSFKGGGSIDVQGVAPHALSTKDFVFAPLAAAHPAFAHAAGMSPHIAVMHDILATRAAIV